MPKYLKSDHVEKNCRFLTNGKVYPVIDECENWMNIRDDEGDYLPINKEHPLEHLSIGHRWEVLELINLEEDRIFVRDDATGKFRKSDGTYSEHVEQANSFHGLLGNYDFGPGKTILRIESIVVSVVDNEGRKRKEYEKKLAALKAEYGVE